MSVTVKQINGDSTFLLTFAPSNTAASSPGLTSSSASFSILTDPWLTGPCQIWHSKFSLTHRTTQSLVQHLSELKPDIILISQDKPDHCHEATLRQLPPGLANTIILAEPAAAKKIRGWKYFDPDRVLALTTFSDSAPDNITRFAIPASVSTGNPGEITVAYIPAKRDVTGLHNAIGITYRPPRRPPSPAFPSTANLPPTPPDSSHSSSPSTPKLPLPILDRPRPLSIIYSPHGVTYAHIKPYAISHLVREAALPLTALLHSFDRVQNPWWLGGNISAGFPGGLRIAQNLLARAWISAHDEEKENSGIGVSSAKTRKYSVDEVRSMVEKVNTNVKTEVRMLHVGEEMVLKAG